MMNGLEKSDPCGSRVRKLRPLGSVRGVPGNRHSYRDVKWPGGADAD